MVGVGQTVMVTVTDTADDIPESSAPRTVISS